MNKDCLVRTLLECLYLLISTALLVGLTVLICARYSLNEGVGTLVLLTGFGTIICMCQPVCCRLFPRYFR